MSYENDLLYFALTKDGLPLLDVDFFVDGMRYDSALISGFVSAMKSFVKEFTNKDIRVIDQGDIKLAFEEGSRVSAFYIVSALTTEIKKKVQYLINTFETRFFKNLQDPNCDIFPFEVFKKDIRQTFSEETIREYYVPKLIGTTNKDVIPGDTWPIISNINGIRTIREIVKKTKKSSLFILDALAFLKSQNLIDFRIIVDRYDIVALTQKGTSELLGSKNNYQNLVSDFGKESFNLIREIDGKKTINYLGRKFSMSSLDIKKFILFLLNKRYLKIISKELKIVLLIEKLYNSIINFMKLIFGKRASQIFNKALEEEKSPLVQLIHLNDSELFTFEHLKTYLEGQENINIPEMLEALSSPISRVFKDLKKIQGLKYVNHLKQKILEKLKNDFGSEYIGEIEMLLLY